MMRLIVTASAISLMALVSAAGPVGNWTGRFQVSAASANMPPSQRAIVAKMVAELRSGRLLLTLKSDRTYTTKAIGLPFGQSDPGGTWTQSGTIVRLHPGRSGPVIAATLSKDGKTMTAVLPKGEGRIVFTR